MVHVFAVTESSVLARSLERYFRFTRGIAINHYRASTRVPGDEQPEQWVSQSFFQLADWIESNDGVNGNESSLRGAICIIDLCEESILGLEALNPLRTRQTDWAAVVAMLALAFPEIHWVFSTPYTYTNKMLFSRAHILIHKDLGFNRNGAGLPGLQGEAEAPPRSNETPSYQTLSEALRLHNGKFNALFDPSGLRNSIREQILKNYAGGKSIAQYIPIRKLVAAAIDEEEAYAYFSAYTAYRFGFRVHTVCSYMMMDEMFGNAPSGEPASLVFEDLYLNFPDKPPLKDEKGGDIHLSDLGQRDQIFKELTNASYRVIVTVGHRRHDGTATDVKNRKYLRGLAKTKSNILYKPLTGTFDLWQRSGLNRWLHSTGGQAAGYSWPPANPGAYETVSSHSAPGRLLQIAERLIHRAAKIAQNSTSAPEALHGAMLALEAQEYLGHRTPTTSLEALSLKHKLEVLAECMFYGVEYNIDVQTRLGEIKRDVRLIAEWFRSNTRKLSTLNAEINIISDLALIFRERNQFDEEQECLARIRNLYRHLWFEKNKWYAWLAYPFRWYIEFLLGSIRRFVIAIFLWLIFFGSLFSTLHHYKPPDSAPPAIQHGFFDAIVSFLSLQPPHELRQSEQIVLWLSLVAVLAGYVHLGIFISHLYSIIARR
jgi:hypothetical protein